MQLSLLRARLQRLKWARGVVRIGSAMALVVLVVLGCWLTAFLLDWTLRWSLPWRGLVLASWCGGLAWAAWRWLWPAVCVQESTEDLALIVEREHRIDSDLVAALQFESRPVHGVESNRLAQAVVDYVAAFSPSLDVFAGFRWTPLPRLLGLTGLAAIVLGGCAALWPAHASAFWTRFWLGHGRYPTRTVLTALEINGQTIEPYREQPVELRLTQDEPLAITVRSAGERPASGTIVWHGLASGGWNSWPLTATTTESDFRATAARVSESLQLWVRLGDAQSDPVLLKVLTLPIVDIDWTVSPPQYARSTAEPVPAGARQFAVLQGSRVGVAVRCANKPLTSVALRVNDQTWNLASNAADPKQIRWELPSGTPLDNVGEPLRFELAVDDADGLSPSPPIQGQIRIRTDRVPRVAAAMLAKKVLPSAKPRISFGVVDDFGVASVRLLLEIVRTDGSHDNATQDVWRAASDRLELSVRSEAVLDLSSYQLNKGDEVRVQVEATDVRGEFPGQVGLSEPLVLDVTDRTGILAGLLEADQQSAKQLDAIIQRELGIGRSKR